MTEGQKLVLHHVLLQAQHDDPLKLKSDDNSWIFHLYLVKGPKKTTLMRCGFICDIGVAVRGARKQESCARNCTRLDTKK